MSSKENQKNKKEEQQTSEASTTASIVGFSAPFGTHSRKKTSKKKKKSNSSKPYGEPELFENAVALLELNAKRTNEVVKKRGDRWVFFDDDDPSIELGSFPSREAAWERQRLNRKRKEMQKKAGGGKKTKPGKAKKGKAKGRGKKAKKVKRPDKQYDIAAPPKKKQKKVKESKDLDFLKRIIRENLATLKEQQKDNTTIEWDHFLQSLSSQTIQADSKLKKILNDLYNAQNRALNKAMDAIKNNLSSAKNGFEVKDVEIVRSKENENEIEANFKVKMEQHDKELDFSVKIENARPLIHIPDSTRNTLKQLRNDESKLLRSELIVSQENDLDDIDDVLKVSQKRNNYFEKIEKDVDRYLNNLSPVELSVARKLVKSKYKKIK